MWVQKLSGTGIRHEPDPNFTVDVVDPFFSAAALHFDDMFKRYGAPIVVLNLIKVCNPNVLLLSLANKQNQRVADEGEDTTRSCAASGVHGIRLVLEPIST